MNLPRRPAAIRIPLALLLASFLSVPRVQAQQPLEGRLQAFLDSVQAAGSFPGMTVGLALSDGRTLTLATGVSDRTSERPMMPRDRMMTGSVGKMFFAALALQLVAEGRLELDAPVSRYLGGLDWYPRLPNAGTMTIRMLLSHTSGLVRYEFDNRFLGDLTAEPYRVWRPEELVAYLLDTEAPFTAGDGWTYADTNYIVLGMVMERLTGRTVYEEVRSRFLEPLALTDTIPSDRPVLPGLVQGYAGPGNPFGGRDAMLEDGRFVLNPQFEWTGGGYITSSLDLARWARFVYSGEAFGPGLLEQAVAGVPAPGLGRGTRYGLGVIVSATPLGTTWGHSGYFPGYLTEVRYYPEFGLAVAVQVNTSVGRAVGRSLGSILDSVADRTLMPAPDTYQARSPDGRLTVTIGVGEKTSWSVSLDDRPVILPSVLALRLTDGRDLGRDARVVEVRRRAVDETIEPVVPEKYARVVDRANELTIDFRGDWSLDVRAYDDGAAYRFRTRLGGEVTVQEEVFSVGFPDDHRLFFPTEERFLTHSERRYERPLLSEVPAGKMASLPVLVEAGNRLWVALTESDLQDYPGLYLEGTGGQALQGLHPAYPLQEEQTNDRTVRVVEREPWIARTAGTRTFPWRIAVVARSDADLLTSTMVYRLAPALRIDDPAWIRPGKVAWDWWNANNLYGVGFRAGLNTETYRYYIDFAADHGLEYVILDEGWYRLGDLFDRNPDIDLDALLAHGRQRGVGIILWVVWKTLDDQFEPALDSFRDLGVAGIQVDFMQRDDQPMVRYYWKVAAAAAERRLLVDFHGAYKPAGLRRAYPNVLTREGVRGLEQSKWSENPDPPHNVTLPFTRMLAGPMDYTPGAMRNAQPAAFHPFFATPMSLGTRCHQLAMYVVFESPLQMLCDSPSNYLREPECLAFLSDVPTVWEDTRVLAARVGEYVAVARRRGEDWYVGVMTDWTARELELDLSFLGQGSWRLEAFSDGPNADRQASDHVRSVHEARAGEHLTVRLAPGGGWAARLSPYRP